MTGEPRDTAEQLLREGVERLRLAGSETARLDAELLLGDAVGRGRTALLAHPETRVGGDAAAGYHAAIVRRAAGEPVAYIRGVKEFYGLAFAVDRRALIPRPETERLVEVAEVEVRRRLAELTPPGTRRLRIVDVGTGSGAVVVALSVALGRLGVLDGVELLAFDVSEDALDLARANAASHAVADVIGFERADLLDRGDESGDAAPFDLVLANLPYVRHDALPGLPIAASFEPVLALDGGADGLAVIERLLAQLPARLAEDGLALLEIGGDQGEAIVARTELVLPGWRCTVELDLAGLPRVARIARA